MRYALAATAIVLALFGRGTPKEEPKLHVAPAMVKIRADQTLPKEAVEVAESTRVQLIAARGECELAQLVVSASSQPLRRVDVRSFPLVRRASSEKEKKESSPFIEPAIYRQAFLNLTQPSNAEGGTGWWPDPLIPVKDSTVGESRRAFPVDIPGKRHQPVLIEVCVPRDAPTGDYAGDVQVLRQGREWKRVPVQVSVRRPVIPATSSVPVTFGLSGRSLLFGHYGERKEEHRLELVERYAKNALAHRISLHGMSFRPPTIRTRAGGKDAGLEVDFTEWDREIGPFLDGTVGLDGARFTAIDLRTPEGLEGPRLANYYRRVEAHFREKGWLDRLFAYVMDEPRPEQHEELRQRLRALAAAPGIQRLVTTSLQPDLVGLVDIWTPNVNCLFKKRKPDEYCHAFAGRNEYRSRETKGEKLWWYQSCSSHGCNHGPFGDAALDRYFSGWPRYLVDAPPAASRIMGWLTFAENIGGELYFDMVYAFNSWDRSRGERVDPWRSVHHFGGNGDGTLYYPGRPDVIGGTTHVPVESLRLKYIRDGLEDYELLRLLAETGREGERTARRIARKLARSPFQFTSTPSSWTKAREELFAALESVGEEAPVSERDPSKVETAPKAN